MRPHAVGLKHHNRYVRIPWGRNVRVEEVEGEEVEEGEWAKGVVIYGILGILELTFGAPLFFLLGFIHDLLTNCY